MSAATRIALFVPCFVDQFRPSAAVAAVRVLERLGYRVRVASGLYCCGQPPTNAGLEREGQTLTARFVEAHAIDTASPIVVLSGSCAMHVRTHAAHSAHVEAGADVAARTIEFTAFLHDIVGLPALAAIAPTLTTRAALHIGCHALRGLDLATPSERVRPPANKLAAVLSVVHGLELVPLTRPDECCGFGGTFALGEPDLSVKMGRDRLRDIRYAKVSALITSDLSCTLHLGAIADANRAPVPMWHVAEVMAGMASHP